MKTFKISCAGISPLMMDPMSVATLESLATGVRIQVPKDRPKEVVAAEKIYRDENGRIALPAEMLFAALVGAGRNVKIGKKGISTAATTMLPDFLSIMDSFLPLTNIPEKVEAEEEKKFWTPDLRKGVGYNGKTPTAVAIIRPKFQNWTFEVTVRLDEKKVGKDTLETLFANAGSTQGLASFRPGKKGMFGRFEVTKIEEVQPVTQ